MTTFLETKTVWHPGIESLSPRLATGPRLASGQWTPSPWQADRSDRVGFGAMQLPGPGVMGPPRDHDEAIAVLRRAVELGVDHIDTAQYYGPDVANALIREALHPYPEDLVLVSKVGAVRDDRGRLAPGAAARASCGPGVEDNLRSLGVEQLGAVNLRLMPDEPPARGRPAGAVRGPARRDGRAARGGQDRRRRRLDRDARRRCEQADRAGRHRLRAERLQPGGPAATPAVLDRCRERRRRLRALLPARARRSPGCPRSPRTTPSGAVADRRRRHPRPGRAGLAAARTARTCC